VYMMWTVCLGLGQQHPPLVQIQRKNKKKNGWTSSSSGARLHYGLGLSAWWMSYISLSPRLFHCTQVSVCVFLLPRGDENKEPSFHSIYYVVVERRRRHVWVFSSGWRYVRAVSLTVHSPDNGRVEKQKRHCFVLFVCLFVCLPWFTG
jgi:hypothetical protein